MRCGCRQNRRHTAQTESWLTTTPLVRRSQSANRRNDQCVTPAAASDSCGGRERRGQDLNDRLIGEHPPRPPGRGASSSPTSPTSPACAYCPGCRVAWSIPLELLAARYR